MDTRLRAGEVVTELPERQDAALQFIGRIHTPWTRREDCPRQGRLDGPECRIEVFAPWVAALEGIEKRQTRSHRTDRPKSGGTM